MELRGSTETQKAPHPMKMDGRDVSRIRTAIRLAELALVGLIGEHELEAPFDADHSDVIALLQRADAALDNSMAFLGDALDKLDTRKTKEAAE